jgi:hypothetical protein
MHRTHSVRRLALAAGALALTACHDPAAPRLAAPDDVRGIQGGSYAGNSYPSVGALLFDYDGNGTIDGTDEFCTGSLVAPEVFLTAGHCIITPWTSAGSQWYVSFAPDLYARNIKVTAATGVVVDPQYEQGGTAQLHDLALVFLPKGSTKGMTPLKLPPAGYLDALAAKGALSKALFVNVGYGVAANRTGVPQFSFDGRKYTSKSEFMGLQPTWLGLLMNAAATGEGGDCYGDSGGPKFLDGQPDMVLATVTTGDYPCRATTWDWRLDSPEARGFLGNYLTLP